MSDAASQSIDRRPLSRLVALLALLAVLCLPALHALHLRFADSDEAVAAVHSHDEPTKHAPHHHDAAHCAICLSAQSIHAGAALFDLTVAVAFDAPAAFPPVLYVAPHADAFVPIVAIPRGPPARA